MDWVSIGTFVIHRGSNDSVFDIKLATAVTLNAIWPSKKGSVESHLLKLFLPLSWPFFPTRMHYAHMHYLSGGVPYDGIPTKDISTVSVALVAVIYVCAAAGVIFAVVCLVFNFIFRKKKYVSYSVSLAHYSQCLATESSSDFTITASIIIGRKNTDNIILT